MILLGDLEENYGISNTDRDTIVYHGLTVVYYQIGRQEIARYKEFEYIIELPYHHY